MKTQVLVVSSVAVAVAVALGAQRLALAEDKPMAAGDPAMISVAPGDVKWVDAPPSLPKGAKVAVLMGDPSKPGLFVMRLKLPANYKVPPHWHPANEVLTILSGTFFLGHGDTFDAKAGKAHAVGSFISMPPKMHHFAYVKKETVVQLSSVGPWGITYLNPADDPRTDKAAAAK